MAQLTLEQRAALQNSTRFQQRFQAAMAKIARYHIDSPQPSTYEEYNEKKRKLKEYSRAVMAAGGTVSGQHIADFISSYNDDVTGRLENNSEPFNAETNQLSDVELYDAGTSIVTFERMAGVVAGDETRQIKI